jgi:hypothetical protein
VLSVVVTAVTLPAGSDGHVAVADTPAAAGDLLHADGMDPLVLWMLEGNARARAFYEQAGWRLDGAARTETFGGKEAAEVRYRLIRTVSTRSR